MRVMESFMEGEGKRGGTGKEEEKGRRMEDVEGTRGRRRETEEGGRKEVRVMVGFVEGGGRVEKPERKKKREKKDTRCYKD